MRRLDDPGVRLRAPTLVTRLFDPDEAAIGVQAMVVHAGGTLYTDIYDRKPPLPPLLYAASFSLTDSTDIRLIRVLVTVMLAAAGILVALECLRRWGPRHAWLGGVLLIAGAMALFPADAGAANYAHFALLPGTAAIIWARRGTLLMALAAGVAIGIAILCRQSWLLGVVPACVSIGLHGRWRKSPPIRGRRGCNGRHNRLLRTPRPVLGMERDRQPWLRVRRHQRLVGPRQRSRRPSPGSPHFTCRHGRDRSSLPPPRLLQSDAGQCLATSTCGCGQPRDRRLGGGTAILRPLLVAGPASVGVDRGSRRCGLGVRSRTAAIVGVAVPAVAAWVLLFVPGSFHNRPDPDVLASYVRSHTTAADRVFVWGSYPEVLVAADRLPAGGLVHTDFVVGRSGGRNDPVKTLFERRPRRTRHHDEIPDRKPTGN